MAQRRMFSPQIVESDAFLDMPLSSQALYFHLGMYADDDGFVSPQRIVRMLGTTPDDLKVLIAKHFILPFDNGVIVIKHWRMNNLMRKDWYRPTQYNEQKAQLFLKENGSYTLDKEQGIPLIEAPKEFGNESVTNRSRSIDKDSIGKDNKEYILTSFEEFWKAYPRKVGKDVARKKWGVIKPDQELFKKIMASLEVQKKMPQWTKDDGQFIPHPSTWLNQKRWEDEIAQKNLDAGGKPGKFANVGSKV